MQSTIEIILGYFKIRYTKEYIEDNLLSHPNFPSMLSISDILAKYRIESLGVKVDEIKLEELPLPLIAEVEVEEDKLPYIIQSIGKDEISCFNEKGKPLNILKKDFFKIWTGICLLVEASKDSKEIGIEEKVKSKKLIRTLVSISLILFIITLVNSFLNHSVIDEHGFQFYVLGYLFLKFFGLVTSLFLLWFEIDQYNPAFQKLCYGGKKINCGSVLNSKYSKIFNGTFNLSTIVFAYFFGTTLFLIFNLFEIQALSILALLSFVTIPIVILSIYFQGLIIKQWCRLCIAVQIILTLEAMIVFFGNLYTSSFLLKSIPSLLLLLVVPILGWKLVHPLLENIKKLRLYKTSLRKIKSNPQVFESLMHNSQKIIKDPESLGIIFKNDNAKYNVIKVCNPYCNPCSKIHPLLEDLLNSEIINLQIIFTPFKGDNDFGTMPVRHFLAIDKVFNKNQTQEALDFWYGSDRKDYESFASKYPVNHEDLILQNEMISAMESWCDSQKITHTPTVFVNGYMLPGEYEVNDLIDVFT